MLQLKIYKEDQTDLTAFCNFVIQHIKNQTLQLIPKYNRALNTWEIYLKELLNNSNIDIINIIKDYLNTLYTSYNSNTNIYSIKGNTNIKYNKTQIPLSNIIKTITRGNLELKRCLIIEEAFNIIEKNLPTLYNIWEIQ